MHCELKDISLCNNLKITNFFFVVACRSIAKELMVRIKSIQIYNLEMHATTWFPNYTLLYTCKLKDYGKQLGRKNDIQTIPGMRLAPNTSKR